MEDFNFQLFKVLKGSTLRFDGSPLLFLTFYSNQSGRGVKTEHSNLMIFENGNFKKLPCLGRKFLL